jgi:hypothetical protein
MTVSLTKDFVPSYSALAADLTKHVKIAEVFSKYDFVEAITDVDIPFIIVSQREQPGTNSGFTAQDAMGEPTGISYDPYVQPVPVSNRGNLPQHALAKQLAEGKNVDGPTTSYRELGSSSPSPWVSFARREYNQDLVGLRGLQAFDSMRRSDGVVRGTLRGVKTPVLSARWFMKPCDRTKVADVNAAKFVWKNLTELMTISWPQVLTEALLMADFGYYMFEIVWDTQIIDGAERLYVKKLAPRHPMDVSEWVYDNKGGPNGVWMFPSDDAGNPFDPQNRVFIPIDKLLVFTFDREAGNMEGISILRSAYKHWYFKDQLYKIDAIQKERHGIGIPVIKLPPGFSNDDKLFANELGRNLRTNERAHVVLPPMWEIEFAELQGQPVNALESVSVHDAAIRENVLMQFLSDKTATSEDDQIMFLKATRFIADIICEVFNLHLIPKIMEKNFSRVGKPTLKARRIGENQDWRELSFAIRNLIGAGVIIPDDPLEEMIREELDLPEVDLSTRRYVATPQNKNLDNQENTVNRGNQPNPGDTNKPSAPKPPKVGAPRQQTKPPVGPPRGNAGRDGSGG